MYSGLKTRLMIGIKLEGDNEYLDTLQDTEIELQLENPLFGDAERLSPGSLSIPFNLPGGEASPKNAGKFNNPDVIANVETYTKLKAGLFYSDVPYKSGTIKARVSNGKNTIETNFFFGLNAISEEFKKAKLRDVLNENIVIDATGITKEIYVKYIGSGDVTLIVNGKSYTATTLLDVCALINTDNDASLDSNQFVPFAQYITTGTTPVGGFAQPFAKIWLRKYYSYYDPFLMLTFYLYQENVDPLAELSVSVPDDEVLDYIWDTWDMAAYYAAFATFLDGYITGTYPTDKFRFPAVFNANLYDGELLKDGEGINLVDGSGDMIRNYAAADRAVNSIQPFLRLKWVLEKIATRFGFTLDGDFYTHAKLPNMLLDNSVTLDVPQQFIYNRKFVFWRRSFNLNELVPDITVVEFLKRICGRYNVGMYYNEVTSLVRMQLREPIALSYNYEEITPLAGVIESNEDLRTTGYTLRVPKEDTDALSFEESITVGTPENDFEINCGRLWGLTGAISGGYITGPRVSRKNGDKFGLRIFHYKGIVNNGVNDYPAAELYQADFNESLADFVTPGLHTTFHKYWLKFESNRLLIKLKVNWPLRSLLQFDWELKRMFDRSLFIVKAFKVKLTNRSVKVSDVELFTMK